MPSIDLTFGSAGPLLQVRVGVSAPHEDALRRAGRRIPDAVQGTFLIDTGASHAAVDPGLLAPLRLSPTGSTPIRTPSTGAAFQVCDEFDVTLSILNSRDELKTHRIEALPVITAPFRAQGIDGLIGRDVLSGCVLIVNGPSGQAVLSY